MFVARYTLGLFLMLAAQEPPLDVEQYVQIVTRAHPAAAQSSALVAAGAAERKAARLLADPFLSVTLGRGRPTEERDTEGREASLSITQSLPWPWTYRAGVRAGDRAAEVMAASAEAVRWQIEIEARIAFARLVYARAIAEIAESNETDARALRDLVARRADLGESREIDRIRASVEWLRQQREARAARREAEAAEAALRTLAVDLLPRPLALRGELLQAPPLLDSDSLRERLVDRNPLLAEVRRRAQNQSALLSLARSSRFPGVDLSFFHEQEVDRDGTGIALGVRLPLWNAARGEIAKAQAAGSLAAADAERARLDLLTELEGRMRDVEVAAAQVAALEQILPQATHSFSLGRVSYEEGETSLLDLLDVQRTYRSVQREAVDSRFGLALAVAELQRLVGADFSPWR